MVEGFALVMNKQFVKGNDNKEQQGTAQQHEVE